MIGLLLALSPALQEAALARDPIPARLAAVDPARILADVETLVGFETRHSASATDSYQRGIGAARSWLRGRLDAISINTGGRLVVLEQRFREEVRGLGEVEFVNVVGVLPGVGTDAPRRTYLVSGHYDSRARNGMDGEVAAPGANDDASGTAVVLELARVLSAGEYAADLIFLCAAGEEQGLYGARHFAEQAATAGMLLDGMITNDIVGGIEGGNGVVDAATVRCFSGADGLHSTSRELARAIRASAARYVPDARVRLVFRLDRFGRGGDHIPFHEAGVPAVRLTEANENYARQHEDVREEDGVRYGDLVEFVSAEYMARVARVNGAALLELALAPPPPEAPRMRAAVSYDTQLSWAPVEGAAGYEVVWRDTTAPDWEHVLAVGAEPDLLRVRGEERRVVRATVAGVTADGAFFGVRSVSAAGHRSRVVVPERP